MQLYGEILRKEQRKSKTVKFVWGPAESVRLFSASSFPFLQTTFYFLRDHTFLPLSYKNLWLGNRIRMFPPRRRCHVFILRDFKDPLCFRAIHGNPGPCFHFWRLVQIKDYYNVKTTNLILPESKCAFKPVSTFFFLYLAVVNLEAFQFNRHFCCSFQKNGVYCAIEWCLLRSRMVSIAQ